MESAITALVLVLGAMVVAAQPGRYGTEVSFRLLPWHSGLEPHKRSTLREVMDDSSQSQSRNKRAFCTLDLNCFLADKRSLMVDDDVLDEVAGEMCCTPDQVCIYCDALDQVRRKVDTDLSKMLQRRIRRSVVSTQH
ncbi:hypothetical protein CAPTEDRAFT_217079 [Capitella teleta]|uniref:Uncharacterized protein n=1 Tax=Capitella teleta TaxID=283909 RepID=R7TU76_CAPTE|nr:hypothetical protein CAPTEDRAFT_217078 [Capitella teleta]ELT94576.1 hypothetical protein CAPTEDRAFT_217079 [Capitella teleta]|eukprot:ELT94575.1 hypothetical protein CAPTEDRAFT_217078 [Capitella teleta]